ncbi:MAG: cell wall-binding repeat-containing protein, partial [Gracilibacteraceae bacterium]|nr:cell wall-binding repeat-containing protein [Gracilibacteraceae bacterium]
MDYRRKPLAILCVVLMMVTLLPLQLFAVSENLANQRIGGADRYATAAAISQAGWQTAENVILAGGGDANLVDALSAAPLAKLLNAPILISESGRLTPVTAAELRRLGAKTAYVVSGAAVITQAVQNELQTMGVTVVRLGGADRFATSQNIAREIIRRGGVDTIVVTTAYTNADALSIASIAAAGGWPILLSGANGLSAEARAIISEIGPTRTYV